MILKLLYLTIHGKTRILVIQFAVTNIKYNNLGTPFLEEDVKTLDIEYMSLTFNTPNESHVNTLPFTAQIEKDCPFFFYIQTIELKKI